MDRDQLFVRSSKGRWRRRRQRVDRSLRYPWSPPPTTPLPPLRVVPDRWYAVLEAGAVTRHPVRVDRFGEGLVLWRERSGLLRCALDRCPHRGVALSLGRVVDDELECGYHAFRFDGAGHCTAMPCDGPDARIPPGMRLTTLPCREAHGLVWVWWGRRLEPDALPDLPWLPEIPPAAHAAVRKAYVWPVPTSRAVESVFDEHHAPVLHGRGSLLRLRRAVDLRSTESGDRIEHSGRMTTADAGGRSLPFRTVSLQPGLTYLWIDPYVNLVAFDTPIDAATTWRWYCTFADGPVGPVRRVAESLMDMVLLEIVQNREDLWMVRTQSHVQEGVFHDIPVAADSGVKLLMRQRRRLLQEAADDRSAYPRHVQQRLEPPDGAEPRS